IYTALNRGARTGLEIDLAALGLTFKHGKPYHPQTQGKVERYHQTLKKWLRRQPGAQSIDHLQAQIDGFVRYYNEERPHTARECPPMHAWRALDKATATRDGQPLLATTKVRHDRIDRTGCVTLRHRSRLHHIGVGRAHAGKRVLLLVANLDVRVVDDEGELLRHLTLNPSIDYQPRGRDTL
ncbi:MAG: integrase core domain-containing protein, partial [Acidimicrobiales bacterium]